MSEASDPQYQQPVADAAGAAGQSPANTGGPLARGPIGETRGAGIAVLLWIVTLGFYGFYWVFKSHDDIKNYSGQGVGAGLGLVIFLLCSIITPFILDSEVEKMYQADGQESPVSAATGAWVLLPLVGFIIWIVKTQGALNQFWEARGAAPA